jgi:hypothetical protein
MSFGTRRPRLAMGIWMSASFSAFIAPLVTLAALSPEHSDDWAVLIAVLAPIAFALGMAIREGPLDARALRATRRLRAMRPAIATLFVGMIYLLPMGAAAALAVTLAGGLSRDTLILATVAPTSLGAV